MCYTFIRASALIAQEAKELADKEAAEEEKKNASFLVFGKDEKSIPKVSNVLPSLFNDEQTSQVGDNFDRKKFSVYRPPKSPETARYI